MGAGWEKVTFGSTGLQVSPLGIGSSFGVETRDVERAFERGINFLFWGAVRRPAFGRAIRNIGQQSREKMVLAIQSYSRSTLLMRLSVEVALRRVKTDYVDLLTLGWWNAPPPQRIVDAALELQRVGKVKHLMISSHQRPTFGTLIKEPTYGAIMVRYNAAHPGAEREVFPQVAELSPSKRPAVLAFTATRWGKLLDPRLGSAGDPTPRASDCYRFVLANPHVNATLVGPKNAAELDEAMAALDRGPMSEEELAWMRRVGASVRVKATQAGPVSVLDRIWKRSFARLPAA